jgi:hypothetical protein
MLHSLLDALRDGLAAHREYERLISLGMCHDPALRAALSQTSHSREACASDCRREKKTPVRLDARMPRDIGLTPIGFSPRSG